MPEGPEVRIITEWLQSVCRDATCLSIFVDMQSKYYKKEIEGYEKIHKLFPMKINQVTCKGKNIFFHLVKNEETYYLNSTLGLEGHWTLLKEYNQNSRKTHSNLWLTLMKDKEIFPLYYDDSRHFGNLRVLDEKEYQARLKIIGPDLLNENVSWENYYERIKGIIRRTRTLTLKKFIAKPEYFSGIGNYLKSEILYLARLNPNRNINTLTDEEIYRLYSISVITIQEAYKLGGMTIKSFVNPLNKNAGGYLPKVYDRRVDDHGYQIVTESGSGNSKTKEQTTYWVPQLQI